MFMVTKLEGTKKIISNTASYTSSFCPSDRALRILRDGRILDKDETPAHMIERVVSALISVENRYNTDHEEVLSLANEFGELLDQKYCVMSTPILTNAGRYPRKSLSACTVPSLDLVHDSMAHIRKVIIKMHQDGMGTGFSLDDTIDPVSVLENLNQIAIDGSLSGKEDRPVGNMATLSVYHPKILDFIRAKVHADSQGEIWKFNTSVDCDENFFNLYRQNGTISLCDGTSFKAERIFNEISQAAYACADPGLIFIKRMDNDNPIPGVGHYVSTAPCAEVGLTKGESCQFAYINLSRFLTQSNEIEIEKLKRATHILTRMLDNALDISIDNYSEKANKYIMSQKRKIGIGICGLADLFILKGILYESEEARQLTLDLVALINFESKVASHELAKKRGSLAAMELPIDNRHLSTPSFTEKKYGNLSTKYVSAMDWQKLSDVIKTTSLLRNASTIALPPTGRSALIIDASTGVEPIFSREDYISLHTELLDKHHKFIQTAKDIPPRAHLLMAAYIQVAVDESISKTINLSTTATAKDIQDMYITAWELGLKGISIYREGSKSLQPKSLS